MVLPLAHKKIIHKRNTLFIRFQSDQWKRVQPAWRKPRGIDNPVRRQYLGHRPMVSQGYGSDKATRHMLRNGFYEFLIHNVKDLEALRTQNTTYAALIGSQVSAKTRKLIVSKAKELNIKVMNGKARLNKEEK
ncbi:Ribosomal_protein L32 [Hexamita inflata]|uniref:Ribosomal protein L32 n=1 Tax=Hexamita inflata TaxID=28002 RepID=A0AA86U8A0_9EUKA|nr:Ribosomal protein L32 [Hexamita inflata]CAI9938364.1 Ribosomal protein L32 [Hexamita inflata]CAI9947005.1 Ribosomal protein L32 [Hexamita inflata]